MTKKLSNLGFRHAAINVRDPQRSKEFYTRVLGMDLEWEPDPDNVYLTFGGLDNLAIHKAGGEPAGRDNQFLDHLGIMVATPEEVNAWYGHLREQGVEIVKEPKTHRDGARSFYFRDPDGVVIQLIYHEPVARRNQAQTKPD